MIGFQDFCSGIAAILHPEGFDPHHTKEPLGLDEDLIQFGEITDPSVDQVSYTTCNEYDMTEDDLLSTQDGIHSRNSPESFQDTDSAIVVPPGGGSSSGSPVFSRKNLLSMSDGEEKYECYGEQEWEVGEDYHSNSHNNEKHSGKSSSSSRNSKSNNNQSFQRRNSWLRSSLRLPSEKKRLSSNAQASHLYRSSSFNSSRRSSSCESDDMIGDLSIEDDVLDLTNKVQMLQQQISALADGQNSHDEKYSKVKQENAALMARIHTLEEQIREVEIRSEDRIREEQKRFKELMARQDRKKNLEMESYTLRLHSLEKENHELREDILRLKAQLDRLKSEKAQLQEQLSESEYAYSSLQEENKRLQDLSRRERDDATREHSANVHMIEELNKEVQELRQYKEEMGPIARTRTASVLEMPSRYAELETQLRQVREDNRSLKDSNDELQAQLLNSSIQEGRNLLHSGMSNSLAAEFEAMSKDEIMEALREQQEVNAKLKSYIDGMLLNILENYPCILEVKGGSH